MGSEVDGAVWLAVDSATEIPANTSIELAVRVNESGSWGEDDSRWTEVPLEGDLPEALPQGRYLQWRLTLVSTDVHTTPRVADLVFSHTDR